VPDNNPVIHRLIAWANSRDDIRALVLSCSRTNPTVPELVDPLSDYDLDVIIRGDARAWYADRSWLEGMGTVLVGFVEPLAMEYGIEDFGCVIIYEDSVKIDYTILPESIFKQVVAEPELRGGWDDGHRVLLDKDGLAREMKAPTHREFIPRPPSGEEYQELIERFFTESTYVAKNLWRDELIFAKHSLDEELKAGLLRRMLEWQMEIDHGWSVRLGVLGRGLKKRVRPDLWAALERTYAGAGSEENWAALFQTIDLFHNIASEVGASLGYAYPTALEEKVSAYLRQIRALEK
jgi:aminoglycoside 6-adenylyltransferase